MNASPLYYPRSMGTAIPRRGRAAGSAFIVDAATAAFVITALTPLVGYLADSALVLWTALIPALWLGSINAGRLVTLLLITTSTYPVLRLIDDTVGAQQVSTKGLFFSADDPLVAALLLVFAAERLRARSSAVEWFPSSLAALAALYPIVTLVNAFRLEWNQVAISFLYYCKWLQYACLVFVVPQILNLAHIRSLLGAVRRTVFLVSVAAGAFAAYEVLTSIRTGTYSHAALYPRASAFFGTLDPAKFGASEDPVNFGVWAMVAGCIALAFFDSGRKGRGGSTMGLAGALFSILLSASRTPFVAAGVALACIHRIRSSRLIGGTAAIAALAGISYVAAPEAWSTMAARFGSMGDLGMAAETSASSRLQVMLNSPVFQLDQYWIAGHGFSSFRFIAEAHLATVTGSVSRSLYNFLLTVWYDAGPLGLALWIAMFVQINRRLKRIVALQPFDDLRCLAWGLRGALWGLAAASLFGETPYSWRVMGFFYACLGVCLAGERQWTKWLLTNRTWRVAYRGDER